ncbi:MAG: PIN domain-containing protein [Euryarchaeota archaeon]|nr:PIN domain-containing protein [Euryarchaeota archaeon]
MNSSRRSTGTRFRIVVDSNILYSAINFPRGNEYKLFLKADAGKVEIVIPDYVYDETRAAFEKRGINPQLVTDFLDTFHNIHIEERDILGETKTIRKAEEIVRDRKDIPVFVFAKVVMGEDENTYLVSGDEDLLTSLVKEELFGRVKKARMMLKLIEKRE